MEVIVGALLEIFAEVCCQVIAAGGIDLLAGIVGFRWRQESKKAKQEGETYKPSAWDKTFWIWFPLGVILTLVVIYTLIWRAT